MELDVKIHFEEAQLRKLLQLTTYREQTINELLVSLVDDEHTRSGLRPFEVESE